MSDHNWKTTLKISRNPLPRYEIGVWPNDEYIEDIMEQACSPLRSGIWDPDQKCEKATEKCLAIIKELNKPERTNVEED